MVLVLVGQMYHYQTEILSAITCTTLFSRIFEARKQSLKKTFPTKKQPPEFTIINPSQSAVCMVELSCADLQLLIGSVLIVWCPRNYLYGL